LCYPCRPSSAEIEVSSETNICRPGQENCPNWKRPIPSDQGGERLVANIQVAWSNPYSAGRSMNLEMQENNRIIQYTPITIPHISHALSFHSHLRAMISQPQPTITIPHPKLQHFFHIYKTQSNATRRNSTITLSLPPTPTPTLIPSQHRPPPPHLQQIPHAARSPFRDFLAPDAQYGGADADCEGEERVQGS